jgi:hypothetical protein
MSFVETRAAIFASAGEESMIAALEPTLRPMGWVPPTRPVPPAYPALPGEVLRFALRPAGSWRALVPSDLALAYKLTLGLSRHLPGTPVVGLRREFDGTMGLKLYLDGRPLFKWGEDPDLEVPYPILPGNLLGLKEALVACGVRDAAVGEVLGAAMERRAPAFLAMLLERLGLVAVLPALAEVLLTPGARSVAFVDTASPLAI